VRFLLLLAAILLALVASSMSVELYRYRGPARDGGTLEYLFESDATDVPNTVSKERVAEIAADFMTTFYHVQIGVRETQELRTTPVPFWLVGFAGTVKGPLKRDVLRRCLDQGDRGRTSVNRRL
jgi:hypothetical protein